MHLFPRCDECMRPVDAATLIIVRRQREVLMGVRSHRHAFLPNHYVFPGGRVDSGDARVAAPLPLRPEVESRLTVAASPARARALAMAAVRETWEETGLLLGEPVEQPLTTRSPGWAPLFRQGLAPALHRLDYLARAITPPGQVRRFDARFFVVDAEHVQGELRGNGELEDLHWVDLRDTAHLPVISITELVLALLRERLGLAANNVAGRELFKRLAGVELVEHHHQ